LALVGCGDDLAANAGPSGGCNTDIECKGARLCIDHQCVDPSGASAADGGGLGSGSTTLSDGAVVISDAGSSAGGAYPDDPALEAACSLDCKAKHAAG
jgi:hypothetical protein